MNTQRLTRDDDLALAAEETLTSILLDADHYASRVVCMDCGAFVMNTAAHDRFHAAMSGTDVAASRLPDETWSCVKDGVTEPCGECGGCRSVQAENRAAGMPEEED